MSPKESVQAVQAAAKAQLEGLGVQKVEGWGFQGFRAAESSGKALIKGSKG